MYHSKSDTVCVAAAEECLFGLICGTYQWCQSPSANGSYCASTGEIPKLAIKSWHRTICTGASCFDITTFADMSEQAPIAKWHLARKSTCQVCDYNLKRTLCWLSTWSWWHDTVYWVGAFWVCSEHWLCADLVFGNEVSALIWKQISSHVCLMQRTVQPVYIAYNPELTASVQSLWH